MRKLKLLISLLGITLNVLAQDAINSFNGFQRTKAAYPDSAIRYFRRLAVLEPNSAEDLLHNSFSQAFSSFTKEKMTSDTAFLAMLKKRNVSLDSVFATLNKEKKAAGHLLAAFENDTDPFVKANAFPIQAWVNAQSNAKNPVKLAEIGNQYYEYLSAENDLYEQRKGRYGLLIAQLIAKHSQLKPTANQLTQLIRKKLQAQLAIENQDKSRATLQRTAWYRYLFAYTNFIAAQNEAKNNVEKIVFLKLAYQYSPNAADKTVANAFWYDAFFLFGKEKTSFEEDYLAVLGSDEEKFKTLVAMSMNEPSFKAKAKTLAKDKNSFNEYWSNEFNKTFKAAPVFSLAKLDGEKYTLSNKANQWTLIDFWGTWCGPCRAEHPALEKLYKRTQNGDMAKLNIITIASRDNEESVKQYMQQFNYNFPVILSDQKIESLYQVASWPSKFLVNPQGKYVVIPFGVNWEKYIEDYIN